MKNIALELPAALEKKPNGLSLKLIVVIGIAIVFFLSIVVYISLKPVDPAIFWVAFVFLIIILLIALLIWFFVFRNPKKDLLLEHFNTVKDLYQNPDPKYSLFSQQKGGTEVISDKSRMFRLPLTKGKEILVYLFQLKGDTNYRCSVLNLSGEFIGNVDTTGYDMTKDISLFVDKIRKIYDPFYSSFAVPFVTMPRFDPNFYANWVAGANTQQGQYSSAANASPPAKENQ